MTKLQLLALDRIAELGQEVMTTHGDMERWREVKFTDVERHGLSMRLTNCLNLQREYIEALREESEDE